MDFNQRVQKLMDLAAEGKITSEVLAASLNALYEASKLNSLSEEEKRQQVIEASRRRAEENRRNVAEYEEKHREEYRSQEKSKAIEDIKKYLRSVYDTKNGTRLYDDLTIDEMDNSELTQIFYTLESVVDRRISYLRGLNDVNGSRKYPDSILAKMDYNEVERKYNAEAPSKLRMTTNDGYEKKEHTKISDEQWETYLKTLPGYTPTASGSTSSNDELTARIKKAEEDAKAAADERERQEQATRDAAKAAGAGSNSTVVPTPNDPYAKSNPEPNPDPTKTTGPTTGTNGTTGTGSNETVKGDDAEDKDSDEESLNETKAKTTYENQTKSKDRRKILKRRPLYNQEEVKEYGGEIARLIEKRAVRLFLAGTIIGVVSFAMLPLAFPFGSLATLIGLPILLKAFREEKFKGKLGKWIQKYVNADDFKAKLNEEIQKSKISEAAAKAKESSNPKQSDSAKSGEEESKENGRSK